MSATAPRCSSTLRPGASCSPDAWWRPIASRRSSAALTRLIARSGEPIIRKGVDVAMRLMGEQFVTGRTIEEAINASREREARGFTFSYDMLGEAATTAEDAARYLAEYERAVHAIGRASHKRGIYRGAGHLDQALGAASALPAHQALSRDERASAAHKTSRGAGEILRHRPQHRRRGDGPARPLARPARSALARSRRFPAGTASASSSRPTAGVASSSSTGSSISRAARSGA